MLARLFVLLQFTITIPEGEQFRITEHVDQGYRIRFYPPRRSDRPPRPDGLDKITINDRPTFEADVLQIDFLKDTFDRTAAGTIDPPEPVLRRAIDTFLQRLRYVTRAPQILPVNFPLTAWRIEYLNDDETELEMAEGLVRGRGTFQFSFDWIALTSEIWQQMHDLPPDFRPSPWMVLLLDATHQLPDIGSAVVLSTTALEVFISEVLDHLAAEARLSPGLWHWINHRGDWLREPSLEEQYDSLLRIACGHSLKEQPNLWEPFMNLKTARNSFVHEGIAKVGGAPVTDARAHELVKSAWDIIAKIRSWIPPSLQWPEFKHEVDVRGIKKLS